MTTEEDILGTLVTRLKLDELKTLCFHLSIDYETIDGTNKTAKVREFLQILIRENRTQDLLQIGQQLRPDINWQQLTWPEKVASAPSTKTVKKQLPQASTKKTKRPLPSWAKAFMLLLIIAGIAFSSFIYYRYLRQFTISPDLTPSLLSFGEANAESIHYFAKNTDLPSNLAWYSFVNGNLVDSENLTIQNDEIDAYLYFQPRLHSSSSWAGIFFWHTLFVPPRNLSRNSETLIILQAEHNDTVEITFKDVHGNEEKLALPIVSGWAGYRIPFEGTKSVDFNKLQLFEFAYSRGVGSLDTNAFKIAHITFR